MQDRGMFQEQECRSCGCTDDDCTGCYLRTGAPCHWVEQDLCSACAQTGKDGYTMRPNVPAA